MAPGASLADQHTCSKCGQALFAKMAKGGNAPGHYYVHCLPCHFRFTFPLDTPHGPSIPSTMILPAMGPSASAMHTAGNRCVKANCARVAHRSCINKMCKPDCIDIKGGQHITAVAAGRAANGLWTAFQRAVQVTWR